MNRILRKIKSLLVNLSRLGVLHTFHLIYIYSTAPCMRMVLPHLLKFYEKIKSKIENHFFLDHLINHWRQKKDEILKFRFSGYLMRIDDIGLTAEQCEVIRKLQEKSDEIVIADIDQDGFLLSRFGAIRNLPMVSDKKFLKRRRFILRIVAITGYIGVKKDYVGNKLAFINELRALHFLRPIGCNLPSIMDVDFDNLTLTFSYILGSVLREELAKRNASLHDRNTKHSSNLSDIDKKKEWLRRIQEGKRFIHNVVDSQFVESLFEELKKIHKSGFMWNDLKYGNIIIEEKSGNPYMIDFDRSGHYSSLPKSMFRLLSDKEIELFNLHFGTKKMTYNRMKEELKIIRKNSTYSPVYFCDGLKMGDLWKIEVGYGRWHYILKQNLLPLSCKRFLDLGANNAFYSMQMLRNGAREAIGIELNEKNIEQGNFIKRGFEWTDKRRYNFKYIQANMKNIVGMDLGSFDMVMALCCIYYMDDKSIANLVQHISTITDVFIVQCNTEINISRSDPYTYEKASVEYNLQVIKENGFPFIQVIAPYKYSRPLLIAKKKESNNPLCQDRCRLN